MKTTEIRERASDELQNMLQDFRRELWKTRFDNQTNQLDDTSKISKLRKDIARLETILTERRGKQE